jgi:hypothetical protein
LPAIKEYSENINLKPGVLIISQARAGSSLLGNLLSADKKSHYLREPLYFIHGSKSDSTFMESNNSEEIIKYLEHGFMCDIMFFAHRSFHMNNYRVRERARRIRQFGDPDKCKSSEFIVMKEVFVWATTIVSWLRRNPNVKVIFEIAC